MSASGFVQGLKRKAEQLSDLNDQAQISAAAAARAWRQRPASDAVGDTEEGADAYNTDDDSINVSESDDAAIYQTGSSYDVAGAGGEVLREEVDLPTPDILLSTWSPSEHNIQAIGTGVDIILAPNEKVTFLGEYRLHVKSGVVSIYGAILFASPCIYHVYAPTTHAIPCIICLGSAAAQLEITAGSQSLQSLGSICPLFRRIWSAELDKQLLKNSSFAYVRHSKDDPRPIYPLATSNQVLGSILFRTDVLKHKAKIVLVSGRKGTGKSTLARTLVNHTLKNSPANSKLTVCWLDLDPGQPEFGPPGQISLVQMRNPIFGPSFAHAYLDSTTTNRLIAAHSIGSTSPVGDPERYLECCLDLQSRYQKLQDQFPDCHLIINCPGWMSTGSALELALQLIHQLSFSDIVFVGETNLPDGTDPFLDLITSARVHRVRQEQEDPRIPRRHAAQLREMQTVSYFHSSPTGQDLEWMAIPLSREPSWSLSFGGEGCDILGIATQGLHISNPKFLGCILKKWLVAICHMGENDEADKAAVEVHYDSQYSLPYWPRTHGASTYSAITSKSRIIGWGFVSKIDTERSTFELKAPLALSVRTDVTRRTASGNSKLVLIRSMIDTPRWAYLEGFYYEKFQRSKESTLLDGSDSGTGTSQQGLIVIPELLRGDYDESSPNTSSPETEYVSRSRRGDVMRLGQKNWVQRPRIVGRR